MTETDTDILSLLPARLKMARKDMGLSLDAVAKLSGVSRSMVSQIERGESSPTIATLWNLTRALQVDFAGLLDAGKAQSRIALLSRDETPTIDNRGEGCRIRILSPVEDAGQHEVYDITFGTGGKLDSQPHSHGARESLTVIEGMVTVASGEDSLMAGPGDTATYQADVVHSISAVDGPARVFLVVRNA